MKILCGLGNPGGEYERTRHNIGFLAIDAIAESLRAPLNTEKFDAICGQGNIGAEKVLFLKPQTFMNRSGQSLAAAARFYKVDPADVLVIHDELDLPLGRIQLKAGGGTGGHNGLRSIVQSWGEEGFVRLRLGIGKPEGGKERTVGHVLSGFDKAEKTPLEDLLFMANVAAQDWVREGLTAAMNRHNKKAQNPSG